MEIIFVIIVVIWAIWWHINEFKKAKRKMENRFAKIEYNRSGSGIEYIGKIERSYLQMVLKNANTTIEIDGKAFVQKTGEKQGYNISPGEHTITCYEGVVGDKIGAVTLKVKIPPLHVCKVRYTASPLPMLYPGEVKYKLELM